MKKFLNSLSLKNRTFNYILLVLMLGQTYHRAWRIPDGNDFTLYLEASETFFAGQNPYKTDSVFIYIYPLFFCITIYPLTLLNYELAVFIWFAIGFLSLFLSFLEIINFAKIELSIKEKWCWFALLYSALFALLQDNQLNGQVNFILLYLMVLFFKFSANAKIFWASLFLSIAIAIKVTPLIFIGYLFFYKRFKTIVLTLFLLLIWLLLLPNFFQPFAKNIEYYQYYLDTFILHRTQDFGEENLHSGYFSLTTFLSNFTGKISIVLSGAICVLGLAYYQLKERLEVYIFSGYLIAILLISPMSEQHHLILTFPFLVLLLMSKKVLNIILLLMFIVCASINIKNEITLVSLLLLYIGSLLNMEYNLKK